MCKEYLLKLATDEAKGILAAFVKALLLLLSVIYGLCVRIILFCYKVGIFKRHSLERPVVSVGNITLGGVGKTPVVLLIAQFLKEKKLKPAILTRGYMGKEFGQPRGQSDEADLLKESLEDVPVFVGKDRFALGQEGLKNHPIDVFLLDDGFQHWRLKRDLDIVLIDAAQPFGNGCLIPRGILREPLSSLRRADIFVLTKTDLGKENLERIKAALSKINPRAPLVESIHKPVSLIDANDVPRELSLVKGKSVAALCSIGDPQSFENLLRDLGADIKQKFIFMDHHVYTREEIKVLVAVCLAQKTDILITTQKDAVKLRRFKEEFLTVNMFSLKIQIEITKGQDEFFSRLHRVLHR